LNIKIPRAVFKIENPKREPKHQKNISFERRVPSPDSKAIVEEEIMLTPYVGIR